MNPLLKRNLFLMKKGYFVNLIFMLLSIVMWQYMDNGMGVFTVTIPMMQYLSTYTLEQQEDYYNFDIVLNSLPVTRKEIIIAKFQAMVIICAINILFTSIAQIILGKLGAVEINSMETFGFGLALSFLLSMFYGAFGIYFINKYGYAKIKIFSVLIIVIMMSLINIPIYAILKSGSLFVFITGMVAIAAALILIAIRSTINLYNRKEFN